MTHRVGPIILIVIGTLFLLNNFGILHVHELYKWWPLILIVLGIAGLVGKGR